MKAKFDKNAERVILHEAHFFRFVKLGEWEYFERNNCSGIVIILAVTEDNKVILVEQYRPPLRKNVIEFPAGLVNDHDFEEEESLLDGAIRELEEETGYKAQKCVKLLEGPVSGGASSDLVTIVKAEGLTKVGPGGGDETESITVHEVDLNAIDQWLPQMESQGCLIEPKIYTGLYFLKNYNRETF